MDALLIVLFCGLLVIPFAVAFLMKRSSDKLREEQAFPSVEPTDVPDDALACQSSTSKTAGAIFIDEDAGIIHFRNCHEPRRFFTRKVPWFSCPIRDVVATHIIPPHKAGPETFKIVTTRGTGTVSENDSGYAVFRDRLRELVPINQRGYSSDHPLVPVLYIAGGLAGLGFGAIPAQLLKGAPISGELLMLAGALFMLTGMVSGIVGTYQLISFCDRRLKIGVVQPMGRGIIGSVIGMFLFFMLAAGWTEIELAAFMGGGFLVGAAFGIRQELRECGPVN